MNPIHEYARRLEARRSASARLDRIHKTIGNWRLALFVAAGTLAWLSFVRAALSPWWLALPAIVFFVLVVIHERVLQARRRLDRAATFYDRGIARLRTGGREPEKRANATSMINTLTPGTWIFSAMGRCSS